MLESIKTNPLRIEIIKMVLFVSLILIGGIILTILTPMYEKMNWLNLLFYSIVSLLIILYLSISLYVKKQKLAEISAVIDDLENVPTSSSSSSLNVRQKAGVKADETAASYCPRCKSSFTKTYQFCPKCSYCGIIKKLK